MFNAMRIYTIIYVYIHSCMDIFHLCILINVCILVIVCLCNTNIYIYSIYVYMYIHAYIGYVGLKQPPQQKTQPPAKRVISHFFIGGY